MEDCLPYIYLSHQPHTPLTRYITVFKQTKQLTVCVGCVAVAIEDPVYIKKLGYEPADTLTCTISFAGPPTAHDNGINIPVLVKNKQVSGPY